MDRLGDVCLRRNAAIMRHMSTVNVARDLDLLRRALGDDALTFYGASYGTYLGIVYANLYPDKVRALVLDAVVNPGAWAAGDSFDTPLFLRQGSDAGAAATMQQFLRRCDDAGARCAFAGTPPPSSTSSWPGPSRPRSSSPHPTGHCR
jgi:pimeloyl-ACP methyl ester carboxylesterase